MNNSIEFYVNAATGEYTENHAEAVEWNRNGDPVELYRRGACVCTWETPAYMETLEQNDDSDEDSDNKLYNAFTEFMRGLSYSPAFA